MDLRQLKAMGALVPRTVFKREIPIQRPVLKPAAEWANPDEPEETGEFVADSVTAYVRKRASADFLEMMRSPDRDKAHVAVLRCVCHEDGSEVFESLEQCKQMKEWLFIPLLAVVNEVNEFGLKNLKPRTSSGASSRSASAAVRSPNGSKRSQKKNELPGSPSAPSAAP